MGYKRGAIELSITTIVVVVIGITLLTLGLVWVSGIFEKLTGTTEGAFQQVDTQIDEILGQGTGQWLSVSPSTISISRGETQSVKVIIENVDTPGVDYSNVQVQVDCPAGRNIEAKFVDTASPSITSQKYTLNSGHRVTLTVVVTDNGASLETNACVFRFVGATGTLPADAQNARQPLIVESKRK